MTRDHKYVDGFMRANSMRPTGKYNTTYGEVLLADSESLIKNEDDDYKYRAGFVLQRGIAEVGWYADYDFGTTQSERLDDVKLNAEAFMAQLNASGYFDEDRKNDFSPRL